MLIEITSDLDNLKNKIMTTFKKLILDELKALKRGDIVSKIRSIKSSYSSINIYTTDLEPEQTIALQCVVAKYKMGKFDGMIDSYDYSNVIKDLPQVQYVFINNDFSEKAKETAKEFLKNTWATVNDQEALDKFGFYFDQIVHQVCAGTGIFDRARYA